MQPHVGARRLFRYGRRDAGRAFERCARKGLERSRMVPRSLDQQRSRMLFARARDFSARHVPSRGAFRRNEPEEAHERFGIGEARKITDLGDEGESRDRGYPAQAFEGFHGCRDIVLAGALGYCPVEPVPLQGQRPHVFAAFLENELLAGVAKGDRREPGRVGPGPGGFAALIHDALSEQEFRKAVACAHEVFAAIRPYSREVSGRLCRRVGHPAFDHVADGEHARQEHRVALVGLHPVAGWPDHLRHHSDQAFQAAFVELSL